MLSSSQLVALKDILTRISMGSGPFKRDLLEHATAVIEQQKKLAEEGLAILKGKHNAR